MSISTPFSRVGKLVGGSIAAVAVALPLALTATPAHATISNGCNVVPLAPVVTGTVGGTKVVRYSVRAYCTKDRILQVYQQRWEADAPVGLAGDDYQGNATFLKTFATAGWTTFSSFRLLSDTELGSEEIYHRITFRVATINGVSGWTAYQNSATVSIAN